MSKLQPGQKPKICRAQLHDGSPVSTTDFEGRPTIIFFYPQDNTRTCTEEVCNLRDNYALIAKQGFRLVGISPDSPRKHRNFITKYNLPFELISDVCKEFILGFGVWGEKTTFGRKYDGVYRTTFILNASGIVDGRIDEVRARDHAKQILELLKTIKNQSNK